MYCKHCRSRTGNTFSADIGCRTFKRDDSELARHEHTIFHPNKVGFGSVQPMLSNEAQRAKQTRIRTILAESLAAVEKSRVSVLGFLQSCPPMSRAASVGLGWAGCAVGEEPQGTKGRVEREEKTSQLGPFVFGQILGL